jgi:ubiquinone/menaquinone biosynthesis C-methylase UbiE
MTEVPNKKSQTFFNFNKQLDQWVVNILADPVTKKSRLPNDFETVNGVIDARVFLENTYGFTDWKIGQDYYEYTEASGAGYNNRVEAYKQEIEYDRPIYQHFKMNGSILDLGGLTGNIREFLPEDVRFVSLDPFIDGIFQIPSARKEAYNCLSRPLNFISALAEFIPFQEDAFNWVHMRSMLDHVQVPDLALKEVHRVLKLDGKLLIGLYVEGGKSGRKPLMRFTKDVIREALGWIGINRFKDYHTWHPTYKNLLKLITDNGFKVDESYWQPYWKDQVVYVLASKS